MAKQKYDEGVLKEIQAKSSQLEQLYMDRNSMCDGIDEMFLMDWQDGLPTNPNVKLTISPEARNAALGAIRLLIASDPLFSVPREKNTADDVQKGADKIEKYCRAVWDASGRVRQSPVHYDIVTSSVLYGEFNVGILDTEALLEQAKSGSKAARLRAERVASVTPFLFEVYDPRTCYPEFDSMGLTSFFRKATVSAGVVLDTWGQAAIDAGLTPEQRYTDVEICDYWDAETHAVWINGRGGALFVGENEWGEIPVISQITDGSTVFGDPKYQRQPFLYTAWKSKLWERQNLALSTLYTNVFTVGNNPMLVYEALDQDKSLFVNWDTPGGITVIQNGESLTPLIKNAIDPSLVQALETARNLVTESTIYKQTLGEPLGGNAPYSMVALLNQAGRLPLVSIQRRASWGIGKAMDIILHMVKTGGGRKKLNGIVDLKPSDIPDGIAIDAKLDIILPQDSRQNTMVAQQVVASGLASKSWAREQLLNIGQSEEMEKEIYIERMTDLQMQLQMQQEFTRQQAGVQQMPKGIPPQGGAGLPQGLPQGLPGSVPSEIMPQQGTPPAQPGEQVGNGLPMTEPLQSEGGL